MLQSWERLKLANKDWQWDMWLGKDRRSNSGRGSKGLPMPLRLRFVWCAQDDT
jgi:hypothetical protein